MPQGESAAVDVAGAKAGELMPPLFRAALGVELPLPLRVASGYAPHL
jgi:hypothetical protein